MACELSPFSKNDAAHENRAIIILIIIILLLNNRVAIVHLCLAIISPTVASLAIFAFCAAFCM